MRVQYHRAMELQNNWQVESTGLQISRRAVVCQGGEMSVIAEEKWKRDQAEFNDWESEHVRICAWLASLTSVGRCLYIGQRV